MLWSVYSQLQSVNTIKNSGPAIKFKKPKGFFTSLAVVVIWFAISPPIGGFCLLLFLLRCLWCQVGNNLSGQVDTTQIRGVSSIWIVDYNKAIEINPQYGNAYHNQGIAKRRSGDHQGAIADFTKAIEINPQNADAYTNRGNARQLANDLEGACRDWRKAADFGLKEPAEWVKNDCQGLLL